MKVGILGSKKSIVFYDLFWVSQFHTLVYFSLILPSIDMPLCTFTIYGMLKLHEFLAQDWSTFSCLNPLITKLEVLCRNMTGPLSVQGQDWAYTLCIWFRKDETLLRVQVIRSSDLIEVYANIYSAISLNYKKDIEFFEYLSIVDLYMKPFF